MGMLKEFRDFAIKGNVVDLAVGVIIGAAFSKIVDSLVGDVIMPLVGRVIGSLDFSNLFVVLGKVPPGVNTTLADLKKAGVPVLAYGSFITIVVNFLVLAFIIFMMVRVINRLAQPARAGEESGRRRASASAGRHPAAARDPRRAQEPAASVLATRIASTRLASSARPVPAISKAVP